MSTQDNEHVRVAMRRAAALADAGRLDDLRSALKPIVAMAPDHLGALRLTAWSSLEQGLSAEALSISEKLLLLDPAGLESQRLRLRSLMACKRDVVSLARQVSERPDAVFEDRVRYVRVCAAVRRAQIDSGALEAVLSQAEATVSLSHRVAYDLLRAALFDATAAYIRRALVLFLGQIPENSRSLAWASHAQLRLGRSDGALALARRAIASGPNESIAWQVLARARQACGDVSGATKAWLEYQRLRGLRKQSTAQASGSNGTGQNSTMDSSLITSMQ